MSTIVIAHISHRHGDNIAPCASREVALAYVAAFVKEWWHELEDDPALPEDDFEAINLYFRLREDERYSIDERPVLQSIAEAIASAS